MAHGLSTLRPGFFDDSFLMVGSDRWIGELRGFPELRCFANGFFPEHPQLKNATHPPHCLVQKQLHGESSHFHGLPTANQPSRFFGCRRLTVSCRLPGKLCVSFSVKRFGSVKVFAYFWHILQGVAFCWQIFRCLTTKRLTNQALS